MKILAIIAVIFAFLLGSKIYIYRRVLRYSIFFVNHRKLLILALSVLFAAEVGFWLLAKDTRFNAVSYSLLGSCVAITYCLFAACIVADVAGIFVRAFRKLTCRIRAMQTQNPHKMSSPISKQTSAQEHGLDSNALDSGSSVSPAAMSSQCGTDFCAAIAPNATKVSSRFSPGRRRFLKILHDLGIFMLFFLFFFTSRNAALHTPPLRHVQIPLPRLREQKRIALISDVHIGHTLKGDFLARIVEQINTLDADIVVIVGDLVDDYIDRIAHEFAALDSIKSKEGVFYVNGNHEYYHDIESIMRFLRQTSVRVLANESIELSGFNLAGVNDLAGLRFGMEAPDLKRAKQNLNPAKPSILLAHQPKFSRRYDVSDFDLVLSGHTHAGQVFPMSVFVWLDQRYVHGLYTLDENPQNLHDKSPQDKRFKDSPAQAKPPKSKETKLYVSSGAGFWGPSFRFLAPSEIVCIDLLPA